MVLRYALRTNDKGSFCQRDVVASRNERVVNQHVGVPSLKRLATFVSLSRNLLHISRLARNNEPREERKEIVSRREMRVQLIDGITSARNCLLFYENRAVIESSGESGMFLDFSKIRREDRYIYGLTAATVGVHSLRSAYVVPR